MGKFMSQGEKTYQKGIAWAPRWFAAQINALGAGSRQEVNEQV